VTTDITIEANEEYFVVPCTFHPRDEAPFTITFTVDGDLQLRLLAPESEWKVVEEEVERLCAVCVIRECGWRVRGVWCVVCECDCVTYILSCL
jgi:hypothetical protein